MTPMITVQGGVWMRSGRGYSKSGFRPQSSNRAAPNYCMSRTRHRSRLHRILLHFRVRCRAGDAWSVGRRKDMYGDGDGRESGQSFQRPAALRSRRFIPGRSHAVASDWRAALRPLFSPATLGRRAMRASRRSLVPSFRCDPGVTPGPKARQQF